MRKFEFTLFKRVFQENDFFVEKWALNVFNKIKMSKIVPSYVRRIREMNYIDLNIQSPTYYNIDEMPHGNSIVISGDNFIQLSRTSDIGKIYKIGFYINVSGVETDSFFSVGGVLDVNCTTEFEFDFAGESYSTDLQGTNKVEIERKHDDYFLYINDILVHSSNFANTDNTILDKLVDYDVNGELYISNIKITSQDKTILHWWKLNCDLDGQFIDIGKNSYDFFSMFYSVTSFFGYIVRFSKFFGNLSPDINYMRRFLELKGIIYENNSDYDTIRSLYVNWVNVLKQRATTKILEPKNLINNVSLTVPEGEEISLLLQNIVNVGDSYEIDIEVIIFEGCLYDVLSNVEITYISGEVSFSMIVVDGVNELTLTYAGALDEGVTNFKVIVDENKHLYINNVFVESEVTETLIPPNFIFEDVFTVATENHSFNIISIKNNLEQIKYVFNGLDCLFVPDITRNYNYEARIFGLSDYYLSKFFRSDIYPNNNQKLMYVQGELNRLYQKRVETELELIKTGFFDLSWVMGKNSPLQKQTSQIIGFNKLPNKLPTCNSLFDYPMNSVDGVNIGFDDIYIENGCVVVENIPDSYVDIIRFHKDVNLSYCNKWNMQVSPNRSYEVSFRVEVIGDDVDLFVKFGALGGNTKDIKTSASSSLFCEGLNLNRNGYYWFRGAIFSHNRDLSDITEGMTVDVDNTNHLQFEADVQTELSLYLSILNNSAENIKIKIKDVQFRLLELPYTRVVMGAKNICFVYGTNNSTNSNEQLFDKTKNLIPFNFTLKQL